MEGIIWQPTAEMVEQANVTRFMRAHGIADHAALIRRSVENIEWFWDAALEDLGISWQRPYARILDTSAGVAWAKWFVGGQTSIVANCIDRHLERGLGSRVAVIWEGDDGAVRKYTYEEISHRTCQVANALRSMGVGKGDAVGLYMPMVPEIVPVFFGCLKIGAVVIPIFSGFGPAALASRLDDAKAKVLFTADGSYRRGKEIAIKHQADEAAAKVPSLTHVVVLRRTGAKVAWNDRLDRKWEEVIDRQPTTCATETMEAEDRALILYTSGTTGRPKGTVHTHAGCLAQMAKEIGYAFDLKPDRDVFFWVSDIGWMMGPWEMIGVQCHGGTYVIYEGAPNHPNPDRLWEMVARHRITTLGISPTAIRMLMAAGDEWVTKHDLSSLRLLGSTGEPWDPESYMWYFRKVGGSRCPVINISGGTEIVGCLLSPLPITPLKPCTLRGPGLGMDVDVFDAAGRPIRGGIGHLVCKQPAPSMTKGFLNDPQRYLETYWSRWPDVWYHGDWAKVDEDGYWFLYGRSDDTIKVAGKRIGPAEVEAALIEHPAVVEAAAIGVPHEIKGEGVVCFVVLRHTHLPSESLREQLEEQVVKHLGKTVRPEALKFVKALPKTRSAKIVRGTIRRRWLGEPIGDITSVENPDAIEEIGRAE